MLKIDLIDRKVANINSKTELIIMHAVYVNIFHSSIYSLNHPIYIYILIYTSVALLFRLYVIKYHPKYYYRIMQVRQQIVFIIIINHSTSGNKIDTIVRHMPTRTHNILPGGPI